MSDSPAFVPLELRLNHEDNAEFATDVLYRPPSEVTIELSYISPDNIVYEIAVTGRPTELRRSLHPPSPEQRVHAQAYREALKRAREL